MFDRLSIPNSLGPPATAGDEGSSVLRATGEGLLAILVTDLEGFTPLVYRLGDLAAQRIMHAHNRVLRECVAENSGGEIAHTGDGLIAAFRSAARALRCAAEMQRLLGRYNRGHSRTPLRVRIGLHAGEPLPEEERLFGLCINTAVRICSTAEAGHVLVSDLVFGLAAGSSFHFRQHGTVALKGIARPVDLYEFTWRSRKAR